MTAGLHAGESAPRQEGPRERDGVSRRGDEGDGRPPCVANAFAAAHSLTPIGLSRQVLDNKPSFIFWTTLAKTLERESKDASRGTSLSSANRRSGTIRNSSSPSGHSPASSFIQQTLSMGYPKLLRTFHQFFAKISVQTDTVYTRDQQSYVLICSICTVFPIR
jgi:hypothetical protein